jgi:hypothetical protein
MVLDKKYQCVNFLCNNKRLTLLDIYDTQTKVLLDLFNAGYKNAYMSSMYFVSKQNNDYNRIEIFLPNVGRLCLYQTFCDVLDAQIPNMTVFYSSVAAPNITTKITNPDLLNRAIHIIYNARDYFEAHPEHTVTNDSLLKRMQLNEKLFQKRYEATSKKHNGVLQIFTRQK